MKAIQMAQLRRLGADCNEGKNSNTWQLCFYVTIIKLLGVFMGSYYIIRSSYILLMLRVYALE